MICKDDGLRLLVSDSGLRPGILHLTRARMFTLRISLIHLQCVRTIGAWTQPKDTVFGGLTKKDEERRGGFVLSRIRGSRALEYENESNQECSQRNQVSIIYSTANGTEGIYRFSGLPLAALLTAARHSATRTVLRGSESACS
eukprot:2932953-Rhodomonas_salina.1